MTDIHSLSSELDERLTSLFGEDVSDKDDLEATGGSPLAELQVLMLTIDWEISDDTLNAFNKELENLKRLFAGDPYVPSLLKMLSSIIGYLKTKKSRAHPNTLNILRSVFTCLEKVVESADLSFHDKKALLEAEIEGFRKLKSDITGTPATPAAHMLPDRPSVSPEGEPKSEDGGVSMKVPCPDYPADQVREINACIHEEMTALKGELQNIHREFDEMRGALSQTRAITEELRGILQEIPAMAAILSEMQSRIATAPVENASLDTNQQNAAEPDEFWNDPDTIKSVPPNLETADQFSFTEESTGKIEEANPYLEPDAAGQTRMEEQKHAFFLFELAGNQYAVDENPVMKSCRISARKARKARVRGEIRLEDFSTLVRGVKGGIEAAWKNVPARELKKQRFTIIDGLKLEGLSDTKGGGILFLASGDKRMALLTDNLARKEYIGEHLISWSDNGMGDISGKISKNVDEQEIRLIVNADALL